jgi:hypothetical protein
VLDGLTPGIVLAGCAEDAHAALAGLTDDELVGVLRAWARQESWAQARKLAAIAELARRRPTDGTLPGRPGQLPANMSEFAADEVGLALTLTRRSAGAQLDLALALAARPATAPGASPGPGASSGPGASPGPGAPPGPPTPATPARTAPAAPAAPATARTARPRPDRLPQTSRPAWAGPRPGPATRCRRWPGRCS